ncbi:P-loop containing nucleoside triphosphate hydrolase protein [Aspergillus cavernicola]|uniref:P-loop containing nucleoside triphosphate hydrolase protein n=1 Tax=Aspergillus cavernicola TaxID=176166 RepID=A0ABR4IAW2_9EURO
MGKRIRHFAGVESSEQLAFIDELHALGLSSTIELPELVVVGDQSTGKSSVLQAITEISLPVDEGMCTRYPIQISFRQTPPSTKPSIKATITSGPQTEKDDAFLARIQDYNIEKDSLTPEVIREMISKATECMFGKHQRGDKTLCDATLRIERSGPDELHWSIKDLPGLIRKGGSAQAVPNGDSPRLSNTTIAEEIVRETLRNERNIVLVVVDDVDIERQKSLEIVESIQGLRNRGIGVLNKCDKREEGAGSWMVSLLQNDLATVPHLNHGWFGLRNRRPIEPKLTDVERDDAEEREFNQAAWRNAPKDRCGIKSLMNYVDRERRAQLQKSMPQIISEIRQKLRECDWELKKMGEARTSPRAQRYFVLQFCNDMQRMADASLRGQYHDIASEDPKTRLRYMVQERLDEFSVAVLPVHEINMSFGRYEAELSALRSQSDDPAVWEAAIKQHGIYAEIYKEAMICRGRSLPGSVHPDVEEKVFRRMSAHWEGYAMGIVEDAKTLVKECYDILLRLAIPNARVRLEVSRVIGGQLEDWNKDSDHALQALIEDNQVRPLFTRNPSLEKKLSYADQRRNAIFHGRASPKAAPDAIPRDGSFLSTLLNNILQTRAKLECYYEIACYRFIDNVAMQVIERHVLGPKCPLRVVCAETFTQLDNEELSRVAGEDKTDTSTRQRLERARGRYRDALEKWEQLSVL